MISPGVPSRRTALVAATVVVVLAGVLAGRFLGRPEDAAVGLGPCTDPVFTTSADVGWTSNGFSVDQNMWNNAAGTQTLHVCSHRSWYVTATQPDTPSVKVYPNVHRDFDEPRIDSLSQLRSGYGSAGPGRGVYEYAYDIWLNGVVTPGSTEIMIWTDNHGNTLHVPWRGTFSSRGRSYAVWRAGHFIAFVGPDTSSGDVDLLAFFRYVVARGWMAAESTLSQVDFGVEICSTDNSRAEFGVTDFSLVAR
jgi:hypothetical protein